MKAEIYLGRRGKLFTFGLYIDENNFFNEFSDGNYEKLCRNAAKMCAVRIKHRNILNYKIKNGFLLESKGRVKQCQQIPDNGEFVFRKTLEEKLEIKKKQ